MTNHGAKWEKGKQLVSSRQVLHSDLFGKLLTNPYPNPSPGYLELFRLAHFATNPSASFWKKAEAGLQIPNSDAQWPWHPFWVLDFPEIGFCLSKQTKTGAGILRNPQVAPGWPVLSESQTTGLRKGDFTGC